MADRTLNLILTRSKQGHSLGRISHLTKLTIDRVKETLGQATGLTPKQVSIIFRMKTQGYSLDQISQEHGVELQVLEQFWPQQTTFFMNETAEGFETQIEELFHQGRSAHEIAQILEIDERAVLDYALKGESKTYFSEASDRAPLNFRSPPIAIEETKQPQPPESQLTPTFFYSCKRDTNQLDRVNLLTGEKSSHEVPHYQFNRGCRWSELPGGSLLITGGGFNPGVRDVVRLDVRTFAVSAQPPMHTARGAHAAVYHSQYLYVLGGHDSRPLRECERYSCAESLWEVLPAPPVAGYGMSGVEVENSIYALGGSNQTVQKLSLESLTWQLMRFKLQVAAFMIPCFKKDTKVYLVIAKTLYHFNPPQVIEVKTLDKDIGWCSSSYYSRGTLYYESGNGIGSYKL
jgi:hypothetical protein